MLCTQVDSMKLQIVPIEAFERQASGFYSHKALQQVKDIRCLLSTQTVAIEEGYVAIVFIQKCCNSHTYGNSFYDFMQQLQKPLPKKRKALQQPVGLMQPPLKATVEKLLQQTCCNAFIGYRNAFACCQSPLLLQCYQYFDFFTFVLS